MIGVVHLVWAPLGRNPVRAFLDSYRAHPAACEHELVIVLNGVDVTRPDGLTDEPPLTRSGLLEELGDTPHRLIELERPVLDLAAYGEAAARLKHEWLCFVNSYGVVLADGWLDHLSRAAALPGVGVAGATGSWESQAEWRRGDPRGWPRQLSAVRAARRDYPRFPNPHIRTTAFMLPRQDILGLGLDEVPDKRAAYLLESGRLSITRRLQARGRRPVVVGRDGRVYDADDWSSSRTYRAGAQDNLLVADNRTADWARAPRRRRRRLSRDAWGDPDPKASLSRHDAWGDPDPKASPQPSPSGLRSSLGPAGSSPHGALDSSASRDAPTLAVVIVNYRTPELVEKCLASVRDTVGESHLELLVIDNASCDGSVARLRTSLPTATVVEMDDNRGFAAGVNAGFAHTRAEFVLVLNPDTEVRSGAVHALVQHLRTHPRTGLAAPLLEDSHGHPQASGYRRFPGLFTLGLDMCLPFGYLLAHAPSLHPYALSPAALQRGAPVAHVCGAAMAVRRTAYTDAGPLDERFFLYLEETEWQRRMAGRGWAIEVVPSARVCHLVRGGGEGALAPSPHFVAGALTYLHLRRVPLAPSRVVLALALASSWATLRLIACLPSKRAKATGQARAYRSLLGQALSVIPKP